MAALLPSELKAQEQKPYYNQVLLILGILISLIGLLGLLATLLGGTVFSIWLQSFDSVTFPTALALLFLGMGSKTILDSQPYEKMPAWLWPIRWSGALVPFGVGGYYLWHYLEIAHFEVFDLLTSSAYNPPGIPSFITTFQLLIAGIVLLLFLTRHRKEMVVVYLVGIPALLLLNLNLFALGGYWLNVPVLYNFTMAIPTATGLLLTSMAMIIGSLPFKGLFLPLLSPNRKARIMAIISLLSGLAILLYGFSAIATATTYGSFMTLSEELRELYIIAEFATILMAILVNTIALRALHYYNESAYYAAQRQYAAARETIIRRIIQTVHSSPDLEETFQKIADDLGTFLGADRCFISRYDKNVKLLNPPTREYRSSSSITSMLNLDLQEWHQANACADFLCSLKTTVRFDPDTPELTPDTVRFLKKMQVRSGLAGSISYRDECLAILFIHQVQEPRAFTSLELDVINTVCNQAAIAIYQATLLEQEQAHSRALAESERRYAATFDQAGVGIAQVGLDGTWVRMNQRLADMLGYTQEELQRLRFQDITFPEDLAADVRLYQQLLSGEIEHYNLEKRYVRKDGSLMWGSLTASSVRVDGKTDYLIGVVEDITLRKQAEKGITDIKNALDASTIVAITDKQGTITYVNEAFCRISKYAPEELIGQNHRIINSGYHPRSFFKEMWLTISEGGVWKNEIRNRAKDGSFYWVDTTIVPFLDEQGKPYQYIAIRHDITRRKEIELELAASEQTLMDSNRDLTHFATIASHDLQAPLRKIQTFADHLRQSVAGKLSEEELDPLNRIQASAANMQAMVSDLLSLSRIDRGEEFRPVNLNVALEETLNTLQEEIREKRARIEVGSLGNVEGDPVQLKQLFQNLLENALKFQRKGVEPSIRIDAASLDGQKEIRVQDNGIGMKADQTTRIFEPFERLHGKQAFPGTGIGLAICKRIVERHRGTIQAKSAPEQGTTFIIRLPRRQKTTP